MKRGAVVTLVALAVGLGVVGSACDRSTVEPAGEDLYGLWILPHRLTPTVYGYVSAQVIFREDATFVFVGNNPLSSGPIGEFTVNGTWLREGDSVTLTVGDAARTWDIDFRSDGVHFTDPASGETFRLFRPLPD